MQAPWARAHDACHAGELEAARASPTPVLTAPRKSLDMSISTPRAFANLRSSHPVAEMELTVRLRTMCAGSTTTRRAPRHWMPPRGTSVRPVAAMDDAGLEILAAPQTEAGLGECVDRVGHQRGHARRDTSKRSASGIRQSRWSHGSSRGVPSHPTGYPGGTCLAKSPPPAATYCNVATPQQDHARRQNLALGTSDRIRLARIEAHSWSHTAHNTTQHRSLRFYVVKWPDLSPRTAHIRKAGV